MANEKIVRAIVHLEDYYNSMDVGHTNKRKIISEIIADLKESIGWQG